MNTRPMPGNPHPDWIYDAAVGHYLSPGREDFVKLAWERPQFGRLLSDAIAFLAASSSDLKTLRVVDLGCGTGEGHNLTAAAVSRQSRRIAFDYHGIDLSVAMQSVARRRISNHPRCIDARFTQADVRSLDFSCFPADLYLSVGGLYSHLTQAELYGVARELFQTALAATGPLVIVFDVLGRYSLDWLPLATMPHRLYSMSFFVSTAEPPSIHATFYGQAELEALLRDVIPPALAPRLKSTTFWDRSIFVGRHSATGQYNPLLPPLRPHIDALAHSRSLSHGLLAKMRVDDERIGLDRVELPNDVRWRIISKCERWNTTLDELARNETINCSLACERLRAVDQEDDRNGLGIGHSLTAVLMFDADHVSGRV